MERHFDEALRALHQEILRMGGLVEEALAKATKALVARDLALAQQVIAADDAINMREIEIEEHGLRLLALHQPAAADLRFITMALKINNDLERMGDQAVNIAECTVALLTEPLPKPLIDIPRMALLAQQMVQDSLAAFVTRDAALARRVCQRDDEVDRLNDQVCRDLLALMRQQPQTVAPGVDLILIGRHLERVADHATNIAEDVVYLVQGHTIKHHVADA